MRTPTTPGGLRKYDHLPPEEAILRAWSVAGGNELHHAAAKGVVRDAMPLLARALNRLELAGRGTAAESYLRARLDDPEYAAAYESAKRRLRGEGDT